jgi:hypothetical protein
LDFELCTQVWAWLLQTLPLAATGDRRVFIYTLRKEKMSRREHDDSLGRVGFVEHQLANLLSFPSINVSTDRNGRNIYIKARSLFIVIFSLLFFFFFFFFFSRSNYLAMWKKDKWDATRQLLSLTLRKIEKKCQVFSPS